MSGTPRSLYDRIDRILRLVAELNFLETNDLTGRRRGDKPATILSPTIKACVLLALEREPVATN
jgi:hypothetical protein